MRKVWGLAGLPTMPSPASMAQFAQSLPQTLPSMITPTLDVAELDKRIADLRAVEQWLNLNVGMLRTTIQSLEVQRNTIATLRSFGGTMLAAMPGGVRAAGTAAAGFAAPPTPAPAAPAVATGGAGARRSGSRKRPRTSATAAAIAAPLNPAAWWGALQEQFARVAAAAAEGAAAAPAAGAGRSAVRPLPPARRPKRARKAAR
jgi:hypothetical protein